MGSLKSPFTLKDATIENLRPIKVRVIGAGYSGVYLGVRIPQRIRNVDLQIYEKNEGVGGTWWENRYPGCACDVPTHSYQYTFDPNPNWAGFYASAPEIRKYLGDVAEKFGVTRHLKTSHEVMRCAWDESAKKWNLTVKNLVTGLMFEDEADVVVSCRGILNKPVWPKVPGIDDFKGKMMHSAAWDDSYDFTNKKVAMIGGGSSGVQILPELVNIPGITISCFVRSKVWIANPFFDETMEKLGLDPKILTFSEKQQKQFAEDPEYYLQFRKIIEGTGSAYHAITLKDSQMQADSVQELRALMKEKLAKKPEVAENLIPTYAAGCRRLIPGPGYLDALVADNVDFYSNEMASITATGIELKNGKHIDLDAIVCATGFDSSGIPQYEVKGVDGQTIQQRFTPYPETYMSLAVDGFPNYFMMMGPNSALGAGSLTVVLENEGDYIVKCIRKLQKEDYTSMMPKQSRVKDFQEYVAEYFKRTIYVDKCNSWYKNEAKTGDHIIGLWPGSTTHALEMLRAPRWEDFDYESREDNKLRWLGNGWSYCHTPGTGGDPTFYLNPEFVDTVMPGTPENDPKNMRRPFSQ
ncbi:flavin-binding monooxygenase-1 [Coleophoma crateriformis]|uniref:Flavin-binding monooxygenase-1 n=1 Tax=Coleophoma crateriformis TaxID=565419 RepID=A0A3D8Q9B2_9HELO|nr:flavin-binding monooxygenase-1 [Coleophoma crateriformis]